ncbi:hypothetical protein ES705_18484 [subsurface metagenome]
MKLILYLILLLSLLTVNAESKFEIFGYYEPQYTGVCFDTDYYHVLTNKLRIDMKIDYSDDLSFGANFNFLLYGGKTRWNLLDYIPDRVSRTVDNQDSIFYEVDYENDVILDNVYLRGSIKYADITIGRQQISLGTGYAWNPTDIFNIKEMSDTTYEQPGHNAVRLDIPLADRSDAIMIYQTDNDFERFAKLLRIKTGYGHFDYSLIVISSERELTDFINFSSSEQNRLLVGGDIVGELLGLGVWAEYAYNFIDEGTDFAESVLGIDYTFRGGVYVMSEYYRNTEGKTDYRKYDLNDWLRFISAQTKAISRDQVYGLITLPLTDLITVGSSAIISVNDGSFSIIPTLNYILLENLELQGFINIAFGKNGTVFDKDFGNGGVLRMRLYF